MLIKSLQNNNQICINISQERHSLRASALNPLNSLIWLVRNDFPDPTILNMFHVSLEVSRINGFAAVQEYFNAYLPAEEGCWFISQLFDLKQACKATVGLSWSAAELAKDKRNPCTDGCYLGSWSHGLYLLPRFHPGLVKFDFISVLIDRPRQDKSENSKWGERTIEVGEKFYAVFSSSQNFQRKAQFAQWGLGGETVERLFVKPWNRKHHLPLCFKIVTTPFRHKSYFIQIDHTQ